MFPDLDDVPTFTRNDVTVENVAAIDPGFVMIDVEDTVTALRDADIPAAYATVNSPETIIEAIHIVGDALGGQAAEKADAYEKAYNKALDDTRSIARRQRRNPETPMARTRKRAWTARRWRRSSNPTSYKMSTATGSIDAERPWRF